jgi:hypothetical protein
MRYFISIILLCLCFGCATSRDPELKVELVQMPYKVKVLFVPRSEWDGFLGAHGYVGYRTHTYIFWLEGDGPDFKNCKTVESSTWAFSMYGGDVTINEEKRLAVVNAWENVTKADGTKHKIHHSISGKYQIDEIRPATFYEEYNCGILTTMPPKYAHGSAEDRADSAARVAAGRAAQVPLPTTTPFDATPEARAAYLESYRDGYRSALTGVEFGWPEDARAPYCDVRRNGWQDGHIAGFRAHVRSVIPKALQ